jgi:hypothetical protein
VRLSDVREVVRAAQVPPDTYSLDGERHEALCLLAIGQTWYVFLSERGQRHEERSFESEDAVCDVLPQAHLSADAPQLVP